MLAARRMQQAPSKPDPYVLTFENDIRMVLRRNLLRTPQVTTSTAPDTVLSPKGSVSDLRVLYDTGEDGWSLAKLRWKGEEALGMRWNGHAENPIGNPQSRGIPTWFIVPDELQGYLLRRFGGVLEGITDDNDDITRVRIRPLPIRIAAGVRQEDADHDWILSITDRAHGEMEAYCLQTGHRIAIKQPHVRRLIPDTVRDTPGGAKNGILDLTIQLIFEDGQLRFEPHPTLMDRLNQASLELRDTGYDGQQDSIRELINEARAALADESENLGAWEAECLDYAETAVGDNFLRLALTQVHKAIEVNELRPDEYQAGYNYTTRHK